MLDKTITNALLALRAKTIRDGLGGIEHINALLIARGIDPTQQHVRRKIPSDSCKQRELKMIVLGAVRTGPKRTPEICQHLMACKPGMSRESAMKRVYRAIYRMRDRGVLVQDGLAWRLPDEGSAIMPPAASTLSTRD